MNFILTLPLLEHMARVKLAIILWSQDNVRDWILNIIRSNRQINLRDQWQEVEEIVLERASKLPLPLKLKQKVLENIRPVGLNILSWMKFHKYHNFVTQLPATLVWTPQGAIDKKKTAELLVRDETLDIQKRFKLACMYCLVDDINDMQGKYSELGWKFINFEKDNCLTIYWCRDNMFPYSELFTYSAKNIGNVVATNYFLHKLNLQNVDTIKLKTVESLVQGLQDCTSTYEERVSDVLCFLLTTMNVEQRAAIVHCYTYEVLKALLFWPRQSLFLEIAKDNWDFLPKEKYYSLLLLIVNRMSCKYNYLSELFGEFWLQTPESFKEFIADRYIGRLLLELYKKENEKNIHLILKESSIFAKKRIIFLEDGRGIFRYLISGEKWDSVEYLMQKCISSKEEMIKFKEGFKLSVPYVYDYQWHTFFQLVEDCILGYNKRKQNDSSTS